MGHKHKYCLIFKIAIKIKFTFLTVGSGFERTVFFKVFDQDINHCSMYQYLINGHTLLEIL